MIYCEHTTKNHPISLSHPSCLEELSNVIKNEGGNNSGCPTNCFVLNLDKLVKNNNFSHMSSMDISFGISTERINPKIVLVEFKYNLKSPKNITKNEIEDKINDSITLLSREPSINNEYYFVFPSKIKEQALRHFYSLFRKNTKYLITDTEELVKRYFPESR